jgi:hypothetical protein
MTTQVRKTLKERKADYEKALVRLARSIAPREGFFIEPLYHEYFPRDPDGERPAHEAWLFVVSATEDELEDFHRNLIRGAMGLTKDDRNLRNLVDIETILPSETPACLSTRYDFG